MYVTTQRNILLLKSSGDLMKVPFKLHVYTVMMLFAKGKCSKMCGKYADLEMLMESKLMDWAELQQQSIYFQYGTKAVRT